MSVWLLFFTISKYKGGRKLQLLCNYLWAEGCTEENEIAEKHVTNVVVVAAACIE